MVIWLRMPSKRLLRLSNFEMALSIVFGKLRRRKVCPVGAATPLAHTREESRTLRTLKDCQQLLLLPITILRSRVYLLSEKRRNYLVKQENVFFQRKTIEVENIQIIKVDQMIVFHDAMWSITAHSRIRPFFVR